MIEGVELRAVLLKCSIQFVYTDTHMQASIHTHTYMFAHTHTYTHARTTHARARAPAHTHKQVDSMDSEAYKQLGRGVREAPPGSLILEKDSSISTFVENSK